MTRWMILLTFTAMLGWGQGLDDFAWWDSPVAQNLNLSPEQHKQVRATVREYRDRLIEQRAAVQKAEANLADEMNEDQVNEARAADAIGKLVAARGELMRSVSQMSLKLRMVLTSQQWQELQRRRGQRLARGGAMAPGQRMQLQQRLRVLRQRLANGAPTAAQRRQLEQRVADLERALRQEGAPPPAPPARPDAPPAPPGQTF